MYLQQVQEIINDFVVERGTVMRKQVGWQTKVTEDVRVQEVGDSLCVSIGRSYSDRPS